MRDSWGVRIVGRIVYWLVVLAISVALVVALMLWFESRDGSELDAPRGGAAVSALA